MRALLLTLLILPISSYRYFRMELVIDSGNKQDGLGIVSEVYLANGLNISMIKILAFGDHIYELVFFRKITESDAKDRINPMEERDWGVMHVIELNSISFLTFMPDQYYSTFFNYPNEPLAANIEYIQNDQDRKLKITVPPIDPNSTTLLTLYTGPISQEFGDFGLFKGIVHVVAAVVLLITYAIPLSINFKLERPHTFLATIASLAADIQLAITPLQIELGHTAAIAYLISALGGMYTSCLAVAGPGSFSNVYKIQPVETRPLNVMISISIFAIFGLQAYINFYVRWLVPYIPFLTLLFIWVEIIITSRRISIILAIWGLMSTTIRIGIFFFSNFLTWEGSLAPVDENLGFRFGIFSLLCLLSHLLLILYILRSDAHRKQMIKRLQEHGPVVSTAIEVINV